MSLSRNAAVVTVAVLIALAIGSTIAAMPASGGATLGFNFQGTRVAYTVPTVLVQATPAWDPDSGVPPALTFREASVHARDGLPQFGLDRDDCDVKSVTISRPGHDTDHWYYIVRFHCGWSDSVTVPVLLDGQFLEATITER